jgi:hypothetical protein
MRGTTLEDIGGLRKPILGMFPRCSARNEGTASCQGKKIQKNK